MSNEDEMGSDDADGVEPLSVWQRLVSSAIGLGAGGAGAVSVFVKNNQAGSVALLGIGAAFLITAVNGAPIIGAKLKDLELNYATRRKEVLKRVEEEPTERARLTLEILEELDPGSSNDPEVARIGGQIFAYEVAAAIMRVRPDAVPMQESLDFGPDLAISVGRDVVINGVLKYGQDSSVPISERYLRATYAPRARIFAPLAIITNRPIANEVAELAQSSDFGSRVQIIRWRNGDDDRALELGLGRLVDSARQVVAPQSGQITAD